MTKFLTILLCISLAAPAYAIEMEFGKKTIEPGITFIFEGAIKDDVAPTMLHLGEADTDVHLEARVNWSEENAPKGAPAGGFIPFLSIMAKVTNEKTNKVTYVDLVPHVNMIDNFHYARNMALPGEKDDIYTVEFYISPPTDKELAIHHDWMHTLGNQLFEKQTMTFKGLNFLDIANASRR